MKYILLMLAFSATDMDVENAEPMWVMTNAEECQQVADILNRNEAGHYVFCFDLVKGETR